MHRNGLIKDILNHLHLHSFIDYKHYMNEALFTCVNCQLHFENQIAYKQHYKSEHHRYNVKRKLIGLVPLSFQDYVIQFQSDQSSKSQSQAEIYCDLCSKKFMSPQTYKQHINSQKHKQSRKDLLCNSKSQKSQTSSLSQFQVIDDENVKKECLFCLEVCSQKHLFEKHCFPPFKSQCNNLEGLIAYVASTIKRGECIYCQQQFGSQDSVKQHMSDTGHNRLDIDCFEPFQQFYLWKIDESSEQEQTQQIQILEQKEDTSEFSVLKIQTLSSLQEKRQNRIKHTATGVVINGKQCGYRAYKQYYKQFITRKIEAQPRQLQKCLTTGQQQQWKNNRKYIKAKPQFQNISFNHNTR